MNTSPEGDANGTAPVAEENTSSPDPDLVRAQAIASRMHVTPASTLPKQGCSRLIYALTLLVLIGLAALIWYGDGGQVRYRPIPLTAADEPQVLLGSLGTVLPVGWKRDPAGGFAGPDGAHLSVRSGTVQSFNMAPRTASGVVVPNQYTATAYARDLRARMGPAYRVRWSQNFAVGKRSGAEACVGSESGSVARGFAFVGPHMDVVELRFVLPSGEGGDISEQIEQIVGSVHERDVVIHRQVPSAEPPSEDPGDVTPPAEKTTHSP